jgi:hypothetical protein
MVVDAAFLKFLLCLAIGLREIVNQGLIPSYYEFVFRLACNEVVLVRKVPMCLGVVIGIHSPLVVRTPVLRVKEHEHRRQFAVAIEDEL